MNSIRKKLIVSIVLPTLIVYVVILGCTLVFLRARATEALHRDMTRLASSYAGRFDGFLREAAAVADTTASALAFAQLMTDRDLYAQLRANVSHAPFIYGACTAFEPGTRREGEERFAPYVYRADAELAEMNISSDVYDWYADERFTWFIEPKTKGQGVWSAPYFDEGAGNVLMTTYSAPFHETGAFRGVTTVDIDLTRLRQTIGDQIAEALDFVVLTRDGRFIFDPNPQRIMHETLHELAAQSGNREFSKVIPRILSGRAGVETVTGWDDPGRQWVFFAPIVTTDWTFAARMPERVVLAQVRSQLSIAAISLSATLVLIIACIAIVSSRLTKPLARLTGEVRKVAAGNFDARVKGIATRDEIGALSRDFNIMAGQLKLQLNRLAAEEASRQKIEHDLSIAREIQRGLLPVHQPTLPGYDLAGWSQPADQTGGDYYDWQSLSDRATVITIADVTGHGVGPALVTAVCRAYARATFPYDADVGRVLDRINAQLSEDLQAGRFVTYVVAMLLPATNTLKLLSAGHGPFFFYSASENRIHSYIAHDIPLGLSADVGYGPPTILTMQPGDILVLITDGFFEWANSRGEQFGTQRIEEAILHAKDSSSVQLIKHVHDEVMRFAEGTAQLDDLTAVVLKRMK